MTTPVAWHTALLVTRIVQRFAASNLGDAASSRCAGSASCCSCARRPSLTQPVATATGGLEASAVDRLRQDLQAARRKHAKAAVEAKRHEVRAAVAAGSEHEESVARGQLDDLKKQYEDVAGFSTPAVREVGAEIGWADVEPLCKAKGCQITAHFGVEGKGIRVRCARHKEEEEFAFHRPAVRADGLQCGMLDPLRQWRHRPHLAG